MAKIDIVKRPIEPRQLRSCREPTFGGVLTDNGNGTYLVVLENQALTLQNADGLIWLRDAIDSLLGDRP